MFWLSSIKLKKYKIYNKILKGFYDILYMKFFCKTRKGLISMKEKTFKDLGLDDGDKYLEQMAGVLDLAYLEDILNEKDDVEKLEKKMKDIKYKI